VFQIVLRKTGRDGKVRIRRLQLTTAEFSRALTSLQTAEQLSQPAAASVRYQHAGWRGSIGSVSATGLIDTTEVVEGRALRIVGAPSGLTDNLSLQVDDTTAIISAVNYTIDGGYATATSIAGIHYLPALNLVAEVSIGSAAIQDMGGHSLDEYEFLEIMQNSECASAIIAYGVAVGWVLYEIHGIRNPVKWLGLFGRVSLKISAVVGAALYMDSACNGDET